MRKISLISMLITISMCIFIIEAQIPVPVPFPGVKSGLSNIIILVAMVLLSRRDAFFVLIVKIVLSYFITGHGIMYSLAGGLSSFLIMAVFLKPLKNYIWVLSVLGAMAHNTGQILTAVALMGKAVFSYFPVLIISGIITGAFTGIIAQTFIRKSPYVRKLFSNLKFLLIIIPVLFFSGCATKETKDIFAMDTIISLDVYGKNAKNTILEMENELKRIDSKFSPSADFTEDSETKYIISEAKRISDLTGGAFDIELSKLSEVWGFRNKNYKIPTDEEIKTALSEKKYDFGGIAKGYAGDRLVEICKNNGITSGILSLGGNVIAIGENPEDTVWKVAIINPKKPTDYIGYVEVINKAVVTSGDYQRYFEEDGKRYHHILNPETGYPADSGLSSVTVISDSGILADALSTAFFVSGQDMVFKLYDELNFEALLITQDGQIITTENLNFHRKD